MKPVIAAALVCSMMETVSFDYYKAGALPDDWIAGVTGSGSSHWSVVSDPSAPSKPNVLKQSGKGTFPYCIKKSISLADGFVEVKFKPISGKEDQAGGVIWRFKDGNNYYIARANALENNVALYHTTKGKRIVIKSVNTKVTSNQWHTLRVEFAGKSIKVFLNGMKHIEVNDEHITGAGGVGVWTKADSVTAFDDFSYGHNK